MAGDFLPSVVSGLEKYFHHIEIMSEKRASEYEKLIRHLDILPSEFLMDYK